MRDTVAKSAAGMWRTSRIRTSICADTLGEVPLERLHLQRERHDHLQSRVAQFIVDPEFTPVLCDGAFGKQLLDSPYVAEEEARVTRAWKRLQAIRL